MPFQKILVLFAVFALTLTGFQYAVAEIVADPHGIAFTAEIGEQMEESFTLHNLGDQEVAYSISIEIVDVCDDENNRFGPRRDEPEDIRVLLVKGAQDQAYGWHNRDTWLAVFNNQEVEPEQIDIDQIGEIDLNEFDHIAGGEDQTEDYFRDFMENREIIEEFVDGGGTFSMFAGSNSFQNIQLFSNEEDVPVVRGPSGDWGNVNDEFLNEDGDGLIEGIEEEYPILTPFEFYRDDNNDRNRQRIVMRGNSLNYATVAQNDLPEDAVWYYRPQQQEHTSIIADWPFGSGYVLFTGITGTLFFENNWQWSSMMECVNLMRWAEWAGGARWLAIEEREGVIDAEGDLDVILMIDTEGMEAGVNCGIVRFEFDDENQPMLEAPVVLSIESPVANLTGTVTDETDDSAMQNVHIVSNPFEINRFSGNEGGWAIENIPLGEYELIFTMEDYLPMVAEINIEEEGDFELDVSMLHSQCNPSDDEIIVQIAPDDAAERQFEISNDGNGPLTYTAEKRLIGDANADPWTLRVDYHYGADLEDNYIQGAVFDGEFFYVGGRGDDNPVIYVLNRDGELIRTFEQPGDDDRGYKDLAWDGELIWGAGEDEDGDYIFGFDTEGEVHVQIEDPLRPTANLAWDREREWLWISGTTTDIKAIDREGNEHAEISRHDQRVYGLANFPEDSDSHTLYLFVKERDTNRSVVKKINPGNGEMMHVAYIDHEEGGAPYAAFITNQYDVYSWVLMTVSNNSPNDGGDRVDIWQIDARRGWFELNPVEGVIEAGEEQEFTLALNAEDLPAEMFEGELVFTHDGIGGETIIPVTLNVVEGPVHTEYTLELEFGWNMVSVYLQPDEEDVRVLTQRLVEDDLLVMMKDGAGRFYHPEFNFNNIPGWNVAEGYLIKMRGEGELTLEGETVVPDEPIDLEEGWQMISCYLRNPIDAIVALSGLGGDLIMAKDGFGRFYNREWNFSNMGDMMAGRGYLVKMARDAELVYRLEMPDENAALGRGGWAEPELLPVHPATPENMSLLVLADPKLSGEIGVYSGEELVGSGVLSGGRCGIAVWGDDPATEVKDGALNGAMLNLRYMDANGLRDLDYSYKLGDGVYEADDFQVVELTGVSRLPVEFGIQGAYPNPFNNRTRLTYGLTAESLVNFAIYDLQGRQVIELATGKMTAGNHSITVDAGRLASGVYIAQLSANGQVSRMKITLIK